MEAPADHVMFTFRLDDGVAPSVPGSVAGTTDAEQAAAVDRPRD